MNTDELQQKREELNARKLALADVTIYTPTEYADAWTKLGLEYAAIDGHANATYCLNRAHHYAAQEIAQEETGHYYNWQEWQG